MEVKASNYYFYKRSSQIALEDKAFSELFGSIWENTGYIISNNKDVSLAILYKDIFMQGVSDYVNYGFVSYKARDYELLASSKDWFQKKSPFSDAKLMSKIKLDVIEAEKCFYRKKGKKNFDKFNRWLNKVNLLLEYQDSFDFDSCCKVLGIKSENALNSINIYKDLKKKHGDNIRIVTYTGKKKRLNIPTINDIIEYEKANGRHDLSLLFHIGIKRDKRDSAIARSKNER